MSFSPFTISECKYTSFSCDTKIYLAFFTFIGVIFKQIGISQLFCFQSPRFFRLVRLPLFVLALSTSEGRRSAGFLSLLLSRRRLVLHHGRQLLRLVDHLLHLRHARYAAHKMLLLVDLLHLRHEVLGLAMAEFLHGVHAGSLQQL